MDAAAARIKAAGGTLLNEPADRPWGARMFQFNDLDGFKLGVSTLLWDNTRTTHRAVSHRPLAERTAGGCWQLQFP